MTSRFVREQAQSLVDGEDGRIVAERVRKHYGTPCSVDKMMSNVRSHFMRLQRSRPIREDLAESLRRVSDSAARSGNAACIAAVDSFIEKTPKEQYDVMRRQKTQPICDETSVNEALFRVKVLPENMSSFRLSSDEAAKCREKQKLSLLTKNSAVTLVKNGQAFLDRMCSVLRTPLQQPETLLLAALMCVSGRRSAEIFNGRSTFGPVPWSTHHSTFQGQLKKKREDGEHEEYVIPLLCEYSLFSYALEAFALTKKQQRIRGIRREKGEDAVNNAEAAKFYSSQLHYLNKKSIPELNKIHELRNLYVVFVDEMFDHSIPLPRLCMAVLGHDDMVDSLHYASVKVENVRPLHLPLDEERFPQWSREITRLTKRI
jgi:hypothetical protein